MADSTYDLTTLGETMIRLSFPPGVTLATARQADLFAAGAESNVAAALASLGRRTAWASRLPDSPPGHFVANALRQAGVDLTHVTFTPTGRVGTFYVELATPPVPVRVTYDRADSAATEISPDSINWPALLSTRLLHLTGITPALSTSCLAATQEAVRRARDLGVPVSFDINYRRKLWPAERCREALLPLIEGAELLFVAESDAAEVFNLTGPADHKLAALAELTRAKHIVMSIGDAGVLATYNNIVVREPAQPTTLIDRLGAGDALAAGVIDGYLDGDFPEGLRRGAALAALCLRRHGDIVHCTRSELTDLLQSNTGRPQR